MDASVMAGLIVTNLKTQNALIAGVNETELIAYWTLICEGIIDHIIAAAVTAGTTTVTTGSSSGTYPTAGSVVS